MELDERKKKILEAILRTYIETGEPVGSRTVSKYTDLNLSSATIRNEMADLEEMGYILQPHASAGRIPSDLAYRMYVNELLENREENSKSNEEDSDQVLIDRSDQIDQMDQMLQRLAKLLAENTNYTTMVSKPKYKHKKIKFIQLNPMSDAQVLMILVLDNNHVTNRIISLEESVDDNVIAQLNFIINAALNGLDVTEINLQIMQQIRDKAGEYGDLAGSVLESIGEALSAEDTSEIYTSGATNILKYPELSDKEKMASLLTTFEEKQKLQAWVNDDYMDVNGEEHEIQVYIGDESPIESMKDCSVVTGTYRIREGVYGKIGIVGPKRMNYKKVVSTLESCMQQLDDIFKEAPKQIEKKK